MGCLPPAKGSALRGKNLLHLRPLLIRDVECRKANRKFQKLSHLYKLAVFFFGGGGGGGRFIVCFFFKCMHVFSPLSRSTNC